MVLRRVPFGGMVTSGAGVKPASSANPRAVPVIGNAEGNVPPPRRVLEMQLQGSADGRAGPVGGIRAHCSNSAVMAVPALGILDISKFGGPAEEVDSVAAGLKRQPAAVVRRRLRCLPLHAAMRMSDGRRSRLNRTPDTHQYLNKSRSTGAENEQKAPAPLDYAAGLSP